MGVLHHSCPSTLLTIDGDTLFYLVLLSMADVTTIKEINNKIIDTLIYCNKKKTIINLVHKLNILR